MSTQYEQINARANGSDNSLKNEFSNARTRCREDVSRGIHTTTNEHGRQQKLLNRFKDEIVDFILKKIYKKIEKNHESIKKALYNTKRYNVLYFDNDKLIKNQYRIFRFKNRTSLVNFIFVLDTQTLKKGDYCEIYTRIIKKFNDDNKYGLRLTRTNRFARPSYFQVW
jgi:hypothetical protein